MMFFNWSLDYYSIFFTCVAALLSVLWLTRKMMMNWLRNMVFCKLTPTKQETTLIGDDSSSLISQESDADSDDEMQPEMRQRSTNEQGIVIYGQEQGSSSNSTLSLLKLTPAQQETTLIGDDSSSLISQKSDADSDDELQLERRQRNTNEQGIVLHHQEQGSSSNSTLSLLFNWAFRDPSLNEKINSLKEKVEHLHAIRKDVEIKLQDDEKQVGKRRREEVCQWLIAVDEKIEEICSFMNDGQGSSFHSNFSSCIERFIKQVDDLIQRGKFPNGLVLPYHESTRLPLSLGKEPVGINFKRNTKQILEWLQNQEHCIIGVYGMGGVGKTALLSHIHDQLLQDASLDKRIYWVIVSHNCSVHKLQQDIAKELGIESFEESNEKKRAATLHYNFKTMGRSVLFLDDIWEDISLNDVGIPLEQSNCRVILSSRLREVCKKMGCGDKNVIKAEVLSDEEAWDLFDDKLENTLEEEAQKIARCIAKECGGLPLAIITMAHSMRDNVDIDDWKTALNEVKSLRGHSDMKERVFQILEFSYNRIKDNRIQNCFLSCILFCEDKAIWREELIEMWINEGLFDETGRRETQKSKGNSILNKLESWSLLESAIDTVNHVDIKCVKMHDLVRDMAISITQKHPRFIAKARERLEEVPNEEQWSNDLVKVSLSHNFIKEIPSGMAPMTPNLTVLMLNENKQLNHIPNPFFRHMKALKILALSNTSIERLPESVSKLKNLRALLLKRCENLSYVPSVAKLTKLRVLDLSCCFKLEATPKGLKGLKSVKEVGYCPWDISDMIEFSKLIQSTWSSLRSYQFWIRDPTKFERINKSEIWRHGGLNFTKRGVLIMGWEYREEESNWLLPKTAEELNIEKSDMKRRSLEDVFPSPGLVFDEATDLTRIKLKECRGMISITKEGGKFNSFSNLKHLSIEGCGNMKVVFSFREHPPHLPNLATFVVTKCEEVEEIFQSQSISPLQSNSIVLCLPNLQLLLLNDLPKMKAILSNLYIDVPKLIKINLENLPKLKILITEQLQLPNLEKLRVEDCEELEEIFQINKPNPALLKLDELILRNLPKLKWVFPITEQLHLQKLEILMVQNCEEVEEIFQIHSTEVGLPNLNDITLENLPKLKLLLPFTDQFPHLNNLECIMLVNCVMLRSVCRGLLLLTSTRGRSCFAKSCPKLKVVKFKQGQIMVDSKSTIECILSNHKQFSETLERHYPDEALLFSHFKNEYQEMPLWQDVDDKIQLSGDLCSTSSSLEVTSSYPLTKSTSKCTLKRHYPHEANLLSDDVDDEVELSGDESDDECGRTHLWTRVRPPTFIKKKWERKEKLKRIQRKTIYEAYASSEALSPYAHNHYRFDPLSLSQLGSPTTL